jgi:hypothetical protein
MAPVHLSSDVTDVSDDKIEHNLQGAKSCAAGKISGKAGATLIAPAFFVCFAQFFALLAGR